MNKKINIGILAVMFIILSLSLISAVTTINTPAASTTLTSCGPLQTFNVTSTDGVVPGRQTVNLTFYAGSTLTANTSWATLGTNNTLNLTLLGNETITSLNLTGLLEDADNYIINVTVRNSTGAIIGEDTNTGMLIDCTVPTAATSLTPTTDTDGDVTFSGTVTASQTTSCTLRFNGALPPGGQGQTMTHSGSTCSLTINAIPESIYTWFIRASDETNTTDSSTQQTNIDVQTSSGKAAVYIAEGAKSEGGATFSVVSDGLINGISNTSLIIGLIVVIILVVGVIKLRQ